VGDIASVSALLGTFIPRPGSDGGALTPANDAATLALRFAGGAVGTLQVSAVAHLGDRGAQQQVILHGAQGTLEADFTLTSGVAVRGARAAEPSIQPLPIPDRLLGLVDRTQPPFDQMVTHMVAQLRTFVDAIVDERPAVPSFEDGVKAQAVIDAALRSQATGCAVAIADASPS
jgi:predicted dehydrogenase